MNVVRRIQNYSSVSILVREFPLRVKIFRESWLPTSRTGDMMMNPVLTSKSNRILEGTEKSCSIEDENLIIAIISWI